MNERRENRRQNGRALLPQPRWMRDVKIGDVIAEPGGRWRVVREVRRYPSGRLYSVALSINHRSWTNRPYTILNYTDLRIRGFRRIPLKKPYPLDTECDRLISKEINQPAWAPRVLFAGDVVDLP